MLKVAIPIALVVLTAIVYVSIRIGIIIGKKRRNEESRSIDPQTHYELEQFARAVMAPPQDLHDIVVLPDRIKKEGGALLKRMGYRR